MRLPCVSRNKDMHIVASLVLFNLDHHLIDGNYFSLLLMLIVKSFCVITTAILGFMEIDLGTF